MHKNVFECIDPEAYYYTNETLNSFGTNFFSGVGRGRTLNSLDGWEQSGSYRERNALSEDDRVIWTIAVFYAYLHIFSVYYSQITHFLISKDS